MSASPLVGSRVLGGAGRTTAPGSVSGGARRPSWRAACISPWSLNLLLAASPVELFMQPIPANSLYPERPRETSSLYQGQATGVQPCTAQRAFPAASGLRLWSLRRRCEQARSRRRAEGDPVWTGASVQPPRSLQCARRASTPAQGAAKPGHFLKSGIKQTSNSTLGKSRGEGTKYIRCFCFLYEPHEIAELGHFALPKGNLVWFSAKFMANLRGCFIIGLFSGCTVTLHTHCHQH